MGGNYKKDTELVKGYLNDLGVTYLLLAEADRDQVIKKWLHTFSANVKAKTGEWVYKGLKWHGFSWRIENAVSGPEAKELYQSQHLTHFYVFGEDEKWCFHCNSTKYPDLSIQGHDIYVSHHNMKWTMVWTHENPEIGPYFAERKPKN